MASLSHNSLIWHHILQAVDCFFIYYVGDLARRTEDLKEMISEMKGPSKAPYNYKEEFEQLAALRKMVKLFFTHPVVVFLNPKTKP